MIKNCCVHEGGGCRIRKIGQSCEKRAVDKEENHKNFSR